MPRILGLASLLLAASRVAADASSYHINAICTCDQLMRWYNETTGVWQDYWWESANMMSALADLSALDSSYNGTYFNTYADTYANAGEIPWGYKNFIDDYYDDEGWWGLAWLNVYNLTKNQNYLDLAITLFNDIHASWPTTCGGGVWWDKEKNYIASIANELYIQLAAGIANRVGPEMKQSYLDAATAGWDWFWHIGVVGTDGFIVDGVNYTTCQPTGAVYTYNQGVILGAATELFQATGNSTYLDLAGGIADAVTTPNSKLTNANGILVDSCDRQDDCSGDGEQFKGPFISNLRKLTLTRNETQWFNFIVNNAQSIWNNDLNDTNGDCFVGDYWAGPYQTADASSQSVGLDTLVAALAVTS
ncbi:hypothetical protein VTN77DRAFT_6844 [Rasamsonia byssochlamydoides]|uniref:uncharacterized protein n=1 Tax=Rasamsonia byssochlamydoides TaxID=89139 RepID=UPI003744346B